MLTNESRSERSESEQAADSGTGAARRLFNATVCATAIVAADELGLFEVLERDGRLGPARLGRERGWHLASLAELMRALALAEVVTWDAHADEATPGPAFAEVLRDKGYFRWLIHGYGDMLRDLGTLTGRGNRDGVSVPRDGAAIAVAGRDYGARHVDAAFAEALAGVPFAAVADLGCGSADRLVKLVASRPGVRGVGVEMSPQAMEVARASVRGAGLEDRIRLVEADVAALRHRPDFDGIDTLFSFFIGHDLWPRERCIASLEAIHQAFPQARRLLLCDTYRSQADAEPPIFTLGFELTHAVMGQYVPSLDEWRSLFAQTSWRCAGETPIGIPFSRIFDLRRDSA